MAYLVGGVVKLVAKPSTLRSVIDKHLARLQFVQDGGDPGFIEAVERAYLGGTLEELELAAPN